MEKWYVVVRDDLKPGLLVAQACHAAYCFGVQSPKPERENIAVLSASKAKLEELMALGGERKYPCTGFYEPDLGGELTACAFGAEAKKILSSLPLLFRNFT